MDSGGNVDVPHVGEGMCGVCTRRCQGVSSGYELVHCVLGKGRGARHEPHLSTAGARGKVWEGEQQLSHWDGASPRQASEALCP